MTSILIANTGIPISEYTATAQEGSYVIGFIQGYFNEKEALEQSAQTLGSFFNSLITHDKTYITLHTLSLLLENIKTDELLTLLENQIIAPCFGLGDNVAVKNNTTYALSTIYRESNDINRVERGLARKISSDSVKFKTIIQYIENSAKTLPQQINEHAVQDIVSDLSNKKLRSALNIDSELITEIKEYDTYKALRIADIAQTLIVQCELKITSLFQDGYSSNYINAKLGNIYSHVGNDPTQTFTNIMDKKGVPDLFLLYQRGVISIEDIVKIRNNFQGGIFRKWLESADYDESEVIKALINRKNESSLSKFIRFIYPNVVGLAEPITGLAASAIDSYIVSKLVEGWSPSLFLDNVLKNAVDRKIESHERQKRKEEFISRFGFIERNQLCPCQSGKKFKKCHGI